MHKLEAFVVSFNCLDLLSITLPRNLPELDSVIIITKEEDKETIDYCHSLQDSKISIFVTDAFTFDNAKFNKGLSIAQAFTVSKFRDYLITQDTDIILPKNFKRDFLTLNPDIEKFYGIRRVNLDTKQDLDDLDSGKKNLEDYLCYRGSGYGFMSIVNYNSTTYQKLLKEWNGFGYPFWVKEAREIDWIWRAKWGERVFDPPLTKFPECHFEPNKDYDTGLYEELPFRCIHLGMPGRNHETRTTDKFV